MKEGAAGTAETLINAARRLFAQHGYEGASVRALTAEAGANLGAITYHYGSKRELYDRVVASVMAPMVARLETEASRASPVLARVEAVVRACFAYVADNPDMPRLMMQELAMGGVPSASLGGPMSRLHRALQSLVQEGQANGTVREGEAGVMAIFILSVPVHLSLVQVPLQAFIGVDLRSAGQRERVIEHAVSFVCAGLSATEAT